MSKGPVGKGRVDIGEVLGETIAVIGSNLPTLAIVDLLLIGAPFGLEIVGVVLARTSPALGLLSIAGFLALLVGIVTLYGALIYAAMQGLHDRPPTLGDTIQQGLRKFWPVLGWILLVTLGAIVAMVVLVFPWRLLGLNWLLAVQLEVLLLVVPAMILAMVWSVALPSIVIEDRGVFEAFKRSAELTRGRRWSIFFLWLIAGIITLVLELVLAAVFGGFGADADTGVFKTYISPLLNLITVPIGIIMNTALFNQLRGKEGFGSETVAEVFA